MERGRWRHPLVSKPPLTRAPPPPGGAIPGWPSTERTPNNGGGAPPLFIFDQLRLFAQMQLKLQRFPRRSGEREGRSGLCRDGMLACESGTFHTHSSDLRILLSAEGAVFTGDVVGEWRVVRKGSTRPRRLRCHSCTPSSACATDNNIVRLLWHANPGVAAGEFGRPPYDKVVSESGQTRSLDYCTTTKPTCKEKRC